MKFRIVKKCVGYECYRYWIYRSCKGFSDWIFVSDFYSLEEAEDALKNYIAMEKTKDEVVNEVEI